MRDVLIWSHGRACLVGHGHIHWRRSPINEGKIGHDCVTCVDLARSSMPKGLAL